MQKLGHLGCGIALTAALFCGAPGSASAAPMLFSVQGIEHEDLSATVLFTYVGLTESTGRIDVQVTNTSRAYDPRLTAFAFNLPDAVGAIDGFSSSLGRWHADFAPTGINTPGRFGLFDVAALTGPNFNGGSPRKGLAADGTADFSFALVGTGMLALTEQSFLHLGSAGAAGEAAPGFAARFQQVGARGDQSDLATPGTPTAAVPEPTSLLLLGVGLLAAARLNRRKTSAGGDRRDGSA